MRGRHNDHGHLTDPSPKLQYEIDQYNQLRAKWPENHNVREYVKITIDDHASSKRGI